MLQGLQGAISNLQHSQLQSIKTKRAKQRAQGKSAPFKNLSTAARRPFSAPTCFARRSPWHCLAHSLQCAQYSVEVYFRYMILLQYSECGTRILVEASRFVTLHRMLCTHLPFLAAASWQAKSGMGKTAVFVLACLQQARFSLLVQGPFRLILHVQLRERSMPRRRHAEAPFQCRFQRLRNLPAGGSNPGDLPHARAGASCHEGNAS